MSGTVPPGDEEARLLREAVLRTQREGTAALRYEYFAQLALHEALASKYPAAAGFLDHVDQAIKRRQVGSARLRDQPPGQIDFRNRRSMFSLGSSGDNWLLCVDGAAYVGKPGRWFARAAGPAGLLSIDGPFWILALVSAAVEARQHGEGDIGESRCRCYRGVSNLAEAEKLMTNPIGPLRFNDRSDPTRLPIEVWIDDEQRIRRAALVDTPRPGFETWSVIELSEFGKLPPIPAPSPGDTHRTRAARLRDEPNWPRFTLHRDEDLGE